MLDFEDSQIIFKNPGNICPVRGLWLKDLLSRMLIIALCQKNSYVDIFCFHSKRIGERENF